MENIPNQGIATVAIVTHGEELWGAERLRRVLSDAGFRVLGVNAEEVQSAFQKTRPSIVIANLAGGDPGELELCQKLAHLSRAPIIVIGSSADEDTIVSMMESVVDDYLVRPVNPMEMVARIRSILRRSPAKPCSKDQNTVLQEPPQAGRSKRGVRRIVQTMQGWLTKYRGFS